MKRYFAYVRVSTARQSEGVSLLEQRSAIERYAGQHHLAICQWYMEIETAAKRGRPVFRSMLRQIEDHWRGSRGVDAGRKFLDPALRMSLNDPANRHAEAVGVFVTARAGQHQGPQDRDARMGAAAPSRHDRRLVISLAMQPMVPVG